MRAEPLSLALREELALRLAARWHADEAPEQTLADPWFANLYLFRAAHDWQWRPHPRWPCIAGHAYDGARQLLPLFELHTLDLAEARALLAEAGCTGFGPLSAAQAARLDAAAWELGSARDEADYLYRAEAFRHYRGRLLQKKRNLVRQLLAEHRVQAEPYRVEQAAEAGSVLAAWLQAKHKRAGEADDAPCREALALADALGLQGTLFRIDGRCVGFLLAEPIAHGVMVMRFAKARDDLKGLYQHMFQQFCLARPELQWLNFEQDLGQPNFRQTKLSYAPAALLEKLRASPRTAPPRRLAASSTPLG